ncbi:hypothetical protein [Maribacter sp. 2307ULW6-5]|uniref:hypothetical protein n=1 Tax=Maribacter sp. 2307ULW6-5 TaxID=3386275 RepID=UPI0039BC2FB7
MRVFEETQRFTQWWLWLLLAVVSLAVLLPPLSQLAQTGNTDLRDLDTGYWIGLGTMALVVLLFVFMKLHTKIDEHGLSYQFFPIHLRPKTLTWKEVDTIGVRTYKPLLEFGGWGYRIGRSGKALNVKGNKGIQIKLKNGDSLLIGTQKMEEVRLILKKYQQDERI